MRRAEALGDGLHVGHGGGRGTQAEAAVAGGQHGSVIVLAHEAVGGEVGIERHDGSLHGQDDQHRQRQVKQLPQLEVEQRNAQEDAERGVAEHVDGAVEHVDLEGRGEEVAQQHTEEQRPDELRQREPRGQEALDLRRGHQGREGQTGSKQCHGLDRCIGGDQATLVSMLEHVVDGGIGRVVGLCSLGAGFHAHLVDQLAGHGAADQAAQHQAEGGRGHAQVGGAHDVVLFFQHLAPGAGRAVTAREGDGTGDQTDDGIKAQCAGQADAHDVLDHDEGADHQQEEHQADAARLEAGEVGAQADRREEDQHERILQTLVEGERYAGTGMQDVDDDRRQQAAGHGLGNVEVLQELDPVDHEPAHQQDQGGDNERVIGIYGNGIHGLGLCWAMGDVCVMGPGPVIGICPFWGGQKPQW